MEILLLEDIEKLGKAGEIKRVAAGYARNYLIPRGLARPATKSVLKQVKLQQEAQERRLRRQMERLEGLAQQLAGLTLRFKAKVGEAERLYGSITNTDIALAIERELGHSIDKRRIDLAEPIRELGSHSVPVRLRSDLVPHVKVIVEKEE